MSNVIGFYSESDVNGYMSNWYPSRFTADGVEYSTMEQYMMYSKAMYFGDADTAAKILATDDPALIKQLGREAKGFNDTIWDGVRQVIVYRGLLEKFRQNAELRDMLLSTGDAILAECALRDRIWGIGLPMGSEKVNDIASWRGRNLLGFSLMLVRDRLRAEA